MTVAFITEDPTDSEVVGALVDRIFGRRLQRTHYLAKRGFAAVLKSAAPLTIQAARARPSFIIVLVDCDETDDHYSAALPHLKCRLCDLVSALPSAHEVAQLSEGASRLVAALTVRTIETWLAVAGALPVPGSIHAFGSTAAERRRLKELVYGEVSPRSADIVRRGLELVAAADLGLMEATLNSFASFAKLVRA